MKYIIVLGDGMSDRPFAGFGGKTALEMAKKPYIDSLAEKGVLGLVHTVPEGMSPGSDTANLSVMGYDPSLYYTGRSPFEAASIGIDFTPQDVTFRCNLVTLKGDGDYDNMIMLDHSSDEITTEEAGELLEAVASNFTTEEISFHRGFSYRHIILWKNGPTDWKLTPPHDILDRAITEYLPKGEKAHIVDEMMRKSYDILKDHPVNLDRIKRGLKPANSIWLWGEGKKPALKTFADKYHKAGTVISAVDLIKGIARCAELDAPQVEGATGGLHTNYAGKVEAALEAFRNGDDFVYLHVEAPDECSHRFEPENKVLAIELLDSEVVKPLMEKLEAEGFNYRMMVLPDHPTPLELRTHTGDPVPFVIYQKSMELPALEQSYTEKFAEESGFRIEKGHELMDYFFSDDAIRRV